MKKKRKNKSANTKLRDKCDTLQKHLFRGLPCIVCGSIQSCGHHLIPKQFSYSRHHLLNLLPACCTHHKYSNECAAHATNGLAVQEFNEFVKKHHPKHHDFWRYNQKKGIKMNFEAVYDELLWIEEQGREWLIAIVNEGERAIAEWQDCIEEVE